MQASVELENFAYLSAAEFAADLENGELGADSDMVDRGAVSEMAEPAADLEMVTPAVCKGLKFKVWRVKFQRYITRRKSSTKSTTSESTSQSNSTTSIPSENYSNPATTIVTPEAIDVGAVPAAAEVKNTRLLKQIEHKNNMLNDGLQFELDCIAKMSESQLIEYGASHNHEGAPLLNKAKSQLKWRLGNALNPWLEKNLRDGPLDTLRECFIYETWVHAMHPFTEAAAEFFEEFTENPPDRHPSSIICSDKPPGALIQPSFGIPLFKAASAALHCRTVAFWGYGERKGVMYALFSCSGYHFVPIADLVGIELTFPGRRFVSSR